MNEKWLILGLIAVVLVAGCVNLQNAGVVTHNNSLIEANQKCVELCEEIFWDRHPQLNQCTEKECECLC